MKAYDEKKYEKQKKNKNIRSPKERENIGYWQMFEV